ncbi:2-hydroxyacid dehydrogenase [Arthrobacter sp. Br18]|uniref:2-hydroxyacid dehydrogenase n=1 Tax=Arthrobacter sp. Br18 TaxID=1312954 RepID=UPI00047E490A|nr:2-hydroxyacid dehydrogenase [Arthrobacter sp. Br18]
MQHRDRPSSRPISTLTVPSLELRDALAGSSPDIRVVHWNLSSDPEGVARGDIDAVVLPYGGGGDPGPALASVPQLKLVQTQSTGYDGVPELVSSGTAIATAAGVHAAATAELAVGLALASLRGIDVAVRNQQRAVWDSRRYAGLADRRVLLVGVGGIGVEIQRRLEPFEVVLTRVGSSARDDASGHVHAGDELAGLAPHHDVVIVITPLSDATRGLISREVLAAMPDGALLVNVARGPVVDTEALTKEVAAGRLRAAIDVVDPEPLPADHPLWKLEGAIITPHVGGNTGAFWPRIVRLLDQQIRLLGKGEAPVNLVQAGPWAGEGD